MKRQAAEGELSEAPFLRFTSPIQTRYPENDQVNARWYPAPDSARASGKPKQLSLIHI